MKPIDYLKLQAKKLSKDLETRTTYFDAEFEGEFYRYDPKFFDVEALVLHFELNEEHWSGLMKAQHLIAQMVGFKKWGELSQASETEKELAVLLFHNQHKINAEEWGWYLLDAQSYANTEFDAEMKLEVFSEVFAKVEGHETTSFDYRLTPNQPDAIETKKTRKPRKRKPGPQITSLPLTPKDYNKFFKLAEAGFERVFEWIEPDNPELTRKLWNAAEFMDQLLKEDMLPIDRDYALSLVDAFLPNYVIQLAVEADEMATGSQSAS